MASLAENLIWQEFKGKGCPKVIVKYYIATGLPGSLVSCRTSYSGNHEWISLLFKDHPFRHRWTDGPTSSPNDKIRLDGWTLQVVPL